MKQPILTVAILLLTFSIVAGQTTYLDKKMREITGVEKIKPSAAHKKVICKISTENGDSQKVYNDTLFPFTSEKIFKYVGIDYYELLSRENPVPDEIVLDLFVIIWNGQFACFECDVSNDGYCQDGEILIWMMLSGHEKFIRRLLDLKEYRNINLNTPFSDGSNLADKVLTMTTENSTYSGPKLSYVRSLFSMLEEAGAKRSPKRGLHTDNRNAKKYKTITFNSDLDKKNYTWMVENLNYVSASSFELPTNDHKDQAGRLYTYQEATEVCPTGWHLPSKDEWDHLIYEIGKANYAGPVFKGDKGWNHDGRGHNEHGFNAFPSGYKTANEFEGIGDYAYFWSSTKKGNSEAVAISSYAKSDKISISNVNTSLALSVRCVKD